MNAGWRGCKGYSVHALVHVQPSKSDRHQAREASPDEGISPTEPTQPVTHTLQVQHQHDGDKPILPSSFERALPSTPWCQYRGTIG